MIPLFYPPFSNTLKSYFTSVVHFYGELFQQFAGPAHSHNSQESEVLQPEKQAADSSALTEEQSEVEVRKAPMNTSNTANLWIPVQKAFQSLLNRPLT